MERDMLHAYEKAFLDSDPELNAIRGKAYGSLHMVLAGSYFAAGEKREFLRHALRSVQLAPENIARLLAYPARRFRRLLSGGKSSG